MTDEGHLIQNVVCWAVIPAGGSGTRFSVLKNKRNDKLMLPLKGVPVLARTVARLFEAVCISGVVISARPHCIEAYRQMLEAQGFKKPIRWVEGGDTRRESVYRGIQALPDEVSVVAIHDAARPLVDPQRVDEVVQTVCSGVGKRSGLFGAFLAVPVQDTLKERDPESGKIRTVDRQRFWRAQTPQVFDKEAILKAHESISADTPVTDDIQLMELLEMEEESRIQLVKGSESNLKITTPDDFRQAEAWLGSLEH